MNEKRYILIGLFLSWFLPPVGVLWTLSRQSNPNWRQLWINFALTFFGWIPGGFHAVWFLVKNQQIISSQLPQANNISATLSLKNIFDNLSLSNFQIIVAIITSIVITIVGSGGLISLFRNSENQTQISYNYPCLLETERYKLDYKSAYPNLRITPVALKNDNNVVIRLKNENKLIFITSNLDKTWQYVCVEGTVKYGWVSSDYVKK